MVSSYLNPAHYDSARGANKEALAALIDPVFMKKIEAEMPPKKLNSHHVKELISVESKGDSVVAIVDHGMAKSELTFKTIEREGKTYISPPPIKSATRKYFDVAHSKADCDG